MARTICLIHPGALGDMVLATPAIRKLRDRFPGHRLVLCGNGEVAKLFHECGLIDDWMSIGGSTCAALFGGSAPDDVKLKGWLGQCDLAMAWARDDDGTLAAALKHGGALEVRVRSPFAADLNAAHQADRFLETIQESPIDWSAAALIHVPLPLCQRGRAWLVERGVSIDQSIVLVHPGSGSPHKCIKPNVLASVIERLMPERLVFLILEGPADQAQVTELVRLMPVTPRVLTGLDLPTLAGVLSHVSLFIGHDSGVTHLSAMMHVPTVALFGPTNSSRWAPRGSLVTILTGEGCRCPSWERVRQCVEKPCLIIPQETILTVCLARLHGVNPRNSSPSALSLFTPCVRVTS